MTNSELTESSVIVITGGSSGFGEALSKFYLQKSQNVYSLDINQGKTDAHHIICDVRNEDSIQAAMGKIRERSQQIDVLIANAGVVPSWQSTESLDISDFRRVMEINLIGVAATLKHAAPLMRSPGGSIVITGSINSW